MPFFKKTKKNTDQLLALLSSRKEENINAIVNLFKEEQWRKITQSAIFKQGGNKSDVNDVLAETITIIIFKYKDPSFRIESNLKGFFYRTCRNIYLSKYAKNKHTSYLDEISSLQEEASIEELIIQNETEQEKKEMWDKLYAQLGKRCKKMIAYRYIDMLSHKEIGKKLGITPESAKNGFDRCKGKLRKMIGENSNLHKKLKF